MVDFPKAYSEALVSIVRLFEKLGLEYAIIGGLAASLHGEPRTTVDIDVQIVADDPDVDRLLRESVLHGFAYDKALVERTRQSNIVPIDYVAAGPPVRIDIALTVMPFEREATRNAEKVKHGRLRLRVARAEYIIIQKLLAERPEDLRDIRTIMRVHQGKLDLRYIRRLVRGLAKINDFSHLPRLLEDSLSKYYMKK